MADDYKILKQQFTSLHQLSKALQSKDGVIFDGRKVTYNKQNTSISKLADIAKELARKELKLKPNETAADFKIVMDKLSETAPKNPSFFEKIRLSIFNTSLNRTAKAIDKAAKSEDKEIVQLTRKAERLLKETTLNLNDLLTGKSSMNVVVRKDLSDIIIRLRELKIDQSIKELNDKFKDQFAIINEVNNRDDFKVKYKQLMDILILNRKLKDAGLEPIKDSNDLKAKLQKKLSKMEIPNFNSDDFSLIRLLIDKSNDFEKNIGSGVINFSAFTNDDMHRLELIYNPST